jgi:hypothetical protein
MRGPVRAAFAAAASTALLFTGAAVADEPAKGWTANEGTTVTDEGYVSLDASGTTSGTSYENQNLDVAVANGDTITFEYQGTCTAGAPRVFLQGGAYNTWDADPAGEGACGTDEDGDGWFTVVGTVSGIEDGTAGHTGIVNDNINNDAPILVRSLTIAGEEVKLVSKDNGDGDGDGPRANNHGKCVSSAEKGGESRREMAKSDCGKKEKGNRGRSANGS